MRPELSVTGKHVVITGGGTGGGTGIGKAAAIAFAQANAKSVSIVGRRIDRLQTAGQEIKEANSSTQVVLQTGDITNRASIKAALGAIAGKIGSKIDIFLNNAGMLPEEAYRSPPELRDQLPRHAQRPASIHSVGGSRRKAAAHWIKHRSLGSSPRSARSMGLRGYERSGAEDD